MEIRKGSEITPAKLRSLITKSFQLINELDPTLMSLTTGQIIIKNVALGECFDILTIYSDQRFETDIMLEQYAGKDVSYLQRYIDELDKIEEGE